MFQNDARTITASFAPHLRNDTVHRALALIKQQNYQN